MRYPEGCVVDTASVVTGSMLVFRQEHLHEGEPVGENYEKLIIRTDVMYTRTPPVCTDDNGLLAYKTYRGAQLLESDVPFPHHPSSFFFDFVSCYGSDLTSWLMTLRTG